jgi:hypothetical protein
VSRKARFAVIFRVVVLAALGTKMMFAFRKFSRIEREFGFIEQGETRDSVNRRYGKPNYHQGKCGVIHVPKKNCTIEYVYSHPFAPLIPEYYIVSFGNDDQVIEADSWISP